MKATEAPQTRIVSEGASLTLTCPVEGDGGVRWRKDGGEITARSEVGDEVAWSGDDVTWSGAGDDVAWSGDDATLRLVGVTASDAGVYECQRGDAPDRVAFVVEVRGP